MTPALLIDLFSEQRSSLSNLCTFFGTPGSIMLELSFPISGRNN